MGDVNPVLVEVVRDPAVESRHRGAVAVARADGTLVAAWGDVERPVFPRSAVKPLQALPLIETGAADRFGLSAREIALACASHTGTAAHVELARAWLARLGLKVEALGCGAHPPRDEAAAAALIRVGQRPTALHHNCCGKHLGMLTTALHRGEPTADYLAPDHPVQRRVATTIAELAGSDPVLAPVGTDGCGVPTYGLPLAALALAMARLASPETLSEGRAGAVRRILAAMAAEPLLVRGPGQFDSQIIAAAKGAAIAKTGAEGVHVAILSGRGLGVALKIDDGAKRAAECAMAVLLRHLGVAGRDAGAVIEAYAEQPVLNDAGRPVGRVRPAAGWLVARID